MGNYALNYFLARTSNFLESRKDIGCKISNCWERVSRFKSRFELKVSVMDLQKMGPAGKNNHTIYLGTVKPGFYLWSASAWGSCTARRCCWTSARRCWRCAGSRYWSSPCWPDRPEPRQRNQSSYSLQVNRTEHRERRHETERSRHDTQHLNITWSPQTDEKAAAEKIHYVTAADIEDSGDVFLLLSGEQKVEVCGVPWSWLCVQLKNNTELLRTALYNDRKLTLVPDVGQQKS